MVLLYLILANLRNIPGFKVCFVMAGFIIMFIIRIIKRRSDSWLIFSLENFENEDEEDEEVESEMEYFGVILSMVWMNVMCFDCYMLARAQTEAAATEAERKQFIYSCVYGWGCSVVIYIFVSVLNIHQIMLLPYVLLPVVSITFLVMANTVGMHKGKPYVRFAYTIALFIAITVMYSVGLIIHTVIYYESDELIAEVFSIFFTVMSVVIFIICLGNSEVTQYFSKLCGNKNVI